MTSRGGLWFLVFALALGCADREDDLGPSGEAESSEPRTAEVTAEPATPEGPPAPSMELDDEGDVVWHRLFEAERAGVAPDWPEAPDRIPPDGGPWLRSRAWYVVDEDTGEVISAKNADVRRPIASITKLATALVWADAAVDEDLQIRLLRSDKEYGQITRSRLRVGGTYRADDLFYSAVLASDNRAAVMLARTTGLPLSVFIEAMNRRADALGLTTMTFGDPTGLSPENMGSARDVARLLAVAAEHPRVGPALLVQEHRYRRVDHPVWILARVSNKLTRMPHWTIRGGKTGFTTVAGSCIVFRTEIAGRRIIAAFLGARGIDTRYGDAGRLRAWMEALADAHSDVD
jgi:D-alanyl-D-alanine endopeptidase (penicillin-binding protein 7)